MNEELDPRLPAVMRERFTPKQAAHVKWQVLALRQCTDAESLRLTDHIFENDPGHRWFTQCLDAVARLENESGG